MVDNEQAENIVFSIRYSLQQLEAQISKKNEEERKIYFDILGKLDNNIQSLAASVHALQQDVLQLRVAIGESRNVAPVLSPRTPVAVGTTPDTGYVKESASKSEIKWDERLSDVAPEVSFGFKVPNKK